MSTSPPPFIHQTPTEALEQVITRQVSLSGNSGTQAFTKTFEISYPGNADALLDHPATHAAFNQDEYMPYWADLWPSAQMLGQALLQEKATWVNEAEVPWQALEIGCGVGLPGIVALSLGMRVIFSDYDCAALDFVERNAIANGFDTEQFERLPLDWRSPPADLQVNLLLASDVIYEERNISPLIQLMRQVVLPGGQCWLVDPNRPFQGKFEAALQSAGLVFSKEKVTTQTHDGPCVEGSWFRIRL